MSKANYVGLELKLYCAVVLKIKAKINGALNINRLKKNENNYFFSKK
ncbi:hypothetical protein AsAng_0001770 [Aureispira anguillae]|uniref:Uncharacterized protein n=1 Tax=Aureispira anguillae TaxID=2864201 RepID=A0A915Y9V5_9BACT|nr:hypothetical protein AsAng_0001770 [Aureispira anguillae]